jgi:hypothetical protein
MSRKQYAKIISWVILAVILALFIFKFWGFLFENFSQYLEIFRKPPQIRQALDQEEIQNIHWYGALKRSFTACLAALLILGPSAIIFAWSKSRIERSLVHIYKIGKYSEIPVHKKDMAFFTRAALPLINAEELKQSNAGIDKALEIYKSLADLQIRQARAPFPPPHVWPSLPDGDISVREIPSMHTLLTSGKIAKGKPMILGYEHGQPHHGSFLDIYSAAVAGESGSGKTATLLYLIGSGIVAESMRFIGIDPHYPHPKSLGYKTKILWEKGFMRMGTNTIAMEEVLLDIETIIENRLQQKDTDTTPVVLVIDELALLNKSSIGKFLAHVMERISTEGRKCAVYMLASSQTWLVARTGDSSVVRDTLTSAFVHRIKPKQANLLLQDSDETEKVKHHIKKPGQALLMPVCDDSTIVQIPFATEDDMRWITTHCDPIFEQQVVNGVSVTHSHTSTHTLHTAQVTGKHTDSHTYSDDELLQQIRERKALTSVSQIAKDIDFDRTYLSKWLNGSESLTDSLRSKLQQYLKQEQQTNIIPFFG